MAKDKRRIEVVTANSAIGNGFLDMAFDAGQSLNIHGFRFNLAFEPEIGEANSNGIVGIYVLPGGVIQNSDLPVALGSFGDEKTAPYLWGLMPWTATNQTPYTWEFAPKTSRNMQAGGRIVADLRIEGQSAGNTRQLMTMTCFTSAI